jgi:hypothetical protein
MFWQFGKCFLSLSGNQITTTMTTSQEIKQHFGTKALQLVKETFGYSTLHQVNKDKDITSSINQMVFSWCVDYGKKKWVWKTEDLINDIKDEKRISNMSNEEFFENLFGS